MENRSGNATAFHGMNEDAFVFALTRSRTATHYLATQGSLPVKALTKVWNRRQISQA